MPLIGPLKLKAQVFCGAETAMGPGKADLLEAIDREGSISAAGRAMGMSYRRTWLLVATMNRCWAEPLVAAMPGAARARARISQTAGGPSWRPIGRSRANWRRRRALRRSRDWKA